ncbi:IclR family transcriptional regulator [Streptomyces albipurpureus]|uniref:IclR family transcriptional regulator n=1 Tax=Streptomyces albipurpureus TaxID=2897419 RepID=A0ABT0UY43_9ACTN|nr:IclR family transcriptional regulator [Streptomyces sp. CWNU-1]MCM2393390.1 IclR family transcriptional regulator [Streptomyces sp. CWNU-1]
MQGVQRVLYLLELVSEHQPVGVADLSRASGLPKSTVQRALGALADSGWIQAVGSEHTRWELTSQMLLLGRRATQQVDLRAAALGPMRELRDLTDETVTLQVPDGNNRMVLIERLDSQQPVRTVNLLGASSPMPITSAGIAVLALMPEEELNRVLAEPVPRLTSQTITDPERIRAGIDRAREAGYAVNTGQNRTGVCAVGAAVVDGAGVPIAGVGVSLPESRFTLEQAPWWGSRIRATAEAITAALSD